MVGELWAKFQETMCTVFVLVEKHQENNPLYFLSRLVPIMDLTNTKVGLNIAIVGRKHVQNFLKSRIGTIGRQLKMTQLGHGAKIQNSMSSAV